MVHTARKANEKGDVELASVLQRINEQMYERNVELTIRNKTLSVQRELYEIINTTLGVKETAERLAHVITRQLGFRGGSILLVNRKDRTLDAIATASAHAHPRKENIPLLRRLNNLRFHMSDKHNIAVGSVKRGQKRVTGHMYDLLTPHVGHAEADAMQKQLQVQTFVIYPIIFGGKVSGVLVLGMDKLVKDLSRTEKETLTEIIDVVGIALEQSRIYAALKNANNRLKELDQMKDDFVSVASHELRTPMTAIKSYLWMALAGKGGKLSKKQAFYLERSYTSTDRLIKLVNDMLNISRIESGRLTGTVGRVAIVKLVEEVREEVMPRAQELKIDVRIEKKKVPFVTADGDKIKEVLFNLIGNSLKFTPEKGVVTITFEEKDDLVVTNVKDSGRGIAVQDIPTLFTKFGMVEGSYTTNKKASGTGLGLFISKSIVELHGGEITPFSEGIGKGSTFSFTLPIYSAKRIKKLMRQNKGKMNQGDEKKEIIHSGL
jgi:signal transduction histidine kinase